MNRVTFFKSIYKYSLIFTLFLIGSLFFLIYKDILVVKFLYGGRPEKSLGDSIKNFSTRMDFKFYFWKDEKLHFEIKSFVWFKDKGENLKHFVSDWLVLLQEEGILSNPIYLNNIAINKDEDVAFLSFEQSLFDKSWSIFEKWNLIESLLKSIRDANFKIREVHFLVNNKNMDDYHLDFSNGWPIDGFY